MTIPTRRYRKGWVCRREQAEPDVTAGGFGVSKNQRNEGRVGFSWIALWQFASFAMLLLLIWANEILDLGSLIYGAQPKSTDVIRACLLSACVIVTAIITVGHTYVQQKRMISGIVTVCAKCHKVRVDEDAWQQIEVYVGNLQPVRFSHGLCPACYEDELAALDGPARPVGD